MRVISRAHEIQAWTACLRRAGRSLGFVPTLGGLHEGHASLIRLARSECDKVVVSVYLNPTQFNSPSDLERYPARADEDLALCEREGVDFAYLGRREDLLVDRFQSWVEVERLTRPLCGAFRPGHFRGVTTVVAQLFHLVRPDRAYFGLKDFQQARVVSRMVRDLLWDAEVRLVPTVREPDGVALSSRNRLLSPAARNAAPALIRALSRARDRLARGDGDVAALEACLRGALAEEPLLKVEYAEVVDAETLDPFPDGKVTEADGGVLLAVAAWAEGVRLIDNVWVRPEDLRSSSRSSATLGS